MTSRTSKRRIFFNFFKNFFNKSVFKKSFYATFLSLNVLKSRFFLIYFAFCREKKLSEGRGLFGGNVLKNPDRYHPRGPRGGKLGLEKLRQKFSRTGERAPGMLVLTNQFHGSFERLPVIGHNRRPASIALLS